MTLIRWNPARGSNLTEIDRLFNGFLTSRPLPPSDIETLSPPVDVEETPEAFILHVDLPGISQKDVKVSFKDDTLTLRAERKRESEKREGSLHRTERYHGVFERSFTLTSPVQAGQISARYRDGVLEIQVPKAEEAKAREIEVQVG